MRQFPGAQAAWLAGVTAGGVASSVGATVAAGDDTAAAVRLDLTGATARRGALRRTAARGGVAARGGARRRAVRLRAARCAAAARLRLRSGFAGAAAALRLALPLAGAPFFSFLAPEPSFWARRTRFQTLRAAAECLRARFLRVVLGLCGWGVGAFGFLWGCCWFCRARGGGVFVGLRVRVRQSWI